MSSRKPETTTITVQFDSLEVLTGTGVKPTEAVIVNPRLDKDNLNRLITAHWDLVIEDIRMSKGCVQEIADASGYTLVKKGEGKVTCP